MTEISPRRDITDRPRRVTVFACQSDDVLGTVEVERSVELHAERLIRFLAAAPLSSADVDYKIAGPHETAQCSVVGMVCSRRARVFKGGKREDWTVLRMLVLSDVTLLPMVRTFIPHLRNLSPARLRITADNVSVLLAMLSTRPVESLKIEADDYLTIKAYRDGQSNRRPGERA